LPGPAPIVDSKFDHLFFFTVKIPPAAAEYADYIFMSGGGWVYFDPAMLV